LSLSLTTPVRCFSLHPWAAQHLRRQILGCCLFSHGSPTSNRWRKGLAAANGRSGPRLPTSFERLQRRWKRSCSVLRLKPQARGRQSLAKARLSFRGLGLECTGWARLRQSEAPERQSLTRLAPATTQYRLPLRLAVSGRTACLGRARRRPRCGRTSLGEGRSPKPRSCTWQLALSTLSLGCWT